MGADIESGGANPIVPTVACHFQVQGGLMRWTMRVSVSSVMTSSLDSIVISVDNEKKILLSDLSLIL